ncbi:hypothetical protein EYF80_012032 [Liparis tanakae]|uniref:Uncharacterized protein n=1 Tax=Liparis tanakae TaxID=230148 RepID=A0A4Z2IJT9_9TELE|nr:hypothetical protein EYF80_012032 [Liparis tanakae]
MLEKPASQESQQTCGERGPTEADRITGKLASAVLSEPAARASWLDPRLFDEVHTCLCSHGGYGGGPTYGRNMMTGSLAAAGVFASEGGVGAVLCNIHSPYHKECRYGIWDVGPDWHDQEVGSLTRVSDFATVPFPSSQAQEAAEREIALQCLIDISRRNSQH